MDDYEPWLTPCDPDFDPEKCESAYLTDGKDLANLGVPLCVSLYFRQYL